jgi:DNA-binding MarR family transcriptional regulator
VNTGPLVDPFDDVALLCQIVATVTADRVIARLEAAGYGDVRVSHGYVFQGLVAGDTTITQLAGRLGVSAQAVSKTVIELEQAGYLHRRRDTDDGRARKIEITRRGQSMLATSRQARAEIAAEITAALGADGARDLAASLRAVSERYGGLDAIAGHRVRPPADTQS